MVPLKILHCPADTLPYLWDFSKFLAPPDDPSLQGDTIISVTAEADPVSLTLGAPTIVADGTMVRLMIGPGIEQQEYRVTITVQTKLGLTAASSRLFGMEEDAR